MSAAGADRAGSPAMERLAAELARPPFNAWLGVRPIGIEADGSIVVALPYRDEFSHDRSEAAVHGGVIASLIDIAGYAAAAMQRSAATPTVSLHVDYLAPAIGELVARSRLRKLGRSLSRVDVDVFAGERLVAMGRGIFSTPEPVQ